MSPGSGRNKTVLRVGYKRLPRKKSVVAIFVDVPEHKAHLVNRIVFKVEGKTSKTRYCAKSSSVGHDSVRFIALFNVKHARARVIIVGCGRTVALRRLNISSTSDEKVLPIVVFSSQRTSVPMGPIAMKGGPNFGIELEMSSAHQETASEVAASITQHSRVEVRDMKDDYLLAKNSHHVWGLMHDGSLVCNRDRPNCNLWELKSRILQGEEGLKECEKVIEAAQSQASIKVNKSMGFHVHIDRSGFNFSQVRNICLTFLRFERAMDSLMPQSRRGDNNEFGASNRRAVGGIHLTHAERRSILLRCDSIEELLETMNPSESPTGGRGGRYFKLNLRTGDKNTFEFRQHSATANSEKVKCFVRFCVALVQNSADVQDFPLDEDDRDDEFELLFKHVIKDRYLRDYYSKRRLHHMNEMEETDEDEDQGSNVQCRLPATLSHAERGNALSKVSLEDRSAYFSISTCPITHENERLMEGISKLITGESYSNLWDAGTYQCARCHQVLYSSEDKWRAQCIWPTFRMPILSGALKSMVVPVGTYNNYLCEVHELYCGSCNLFLGHRFLDGRESGDSHPEAKYRHCTLSLSLSFR
ncbi:hypothetical protein ACHAWF_006957 [Thalassiosira exigua]